MEGGDGMNKFKRLARLTPPIAEAVPVGPANDVLASPV